MKNYSMMFAAILCCTMTMFTACSDDDEKLSVSIPDNVSTTKNLEGKNAIISLPILSEGNWDVSVVDKDKNQWIYLITRNGSGNGNVKMSIGTNLTGEERSAVIRIANETTYVDYTINQSPYLGDGSNSADDVKYQNSGLGMGVYMVSAGNTGGYRSMMADQIFNFSEMDDEAVKDLGNFVETEHLYGQDIKIKDFTSRDSTGTDIKADLSVNIKYGLFKLGMTGNFHMYGSSRDTTRTWACSISRPLTQYTLSYRNIANNYRWKEDATDEYITKRTCLFSPDFLNLQESIETLINSGKTANDEELAEQLELLNAIFGPAFIWSVTRGGVADIDFQRSQSHAKDTLSIAGTLDVAFNSLFSLDVKASATYLRFASSYTSGGELSIHIYGGTMEKQNALINAIAKITNEYDMKSEIDYQTMLDATTDWTASISLDNSDLSDITVCGIWSLFTLKSRNIVKKYMKEKYPNTITKDKKGNEVEECPYFYNVQTLN